MLVDHQSDIGTAEEYSPNEEAEIVTPDEILTPRQYQFDALEGVNDLRKRGLHKPLLVMSTGLGKSPIQSLLPKSTCLLPSLMFVNRIDLVDQLAATAQQWNPDLRVEAEQADRFASTSADIVVASTQTLGRTGNRLDRFPPNHFGLVISDESHLAFGTAAGKILDHFTPELLVGATATPYRGDGKPLANLFDEMVRRPDGTDKDPAWSLRWGIENNVNGPCKPGEGWLCPFTAKRIHTNLDISNLHTRAGDFAGDELGAAVNVDWRNSKIISGIEDHCADRHSIVIFCVDQSHANSMCDQLRQRGHDVEIVLDYTQRPERRRIYDNFRKGKLRIIVAVGVLAFGWDAPITDCIVFAKPSKSRLWFTQASGRGCRRHPDKQDCLLVEIYDNPGRHQLMTACRSIGIKDQDLGGRSLIEAEDLADKAAEIGTEVRDGESTEALEKRLDAVVKVYMRTVVIKTTAEALELLATFEPSEDIKRHSIFWWIKASENRYRLSAPGERDEHGKAKGQIWITLWADALDRWQITNGTNTYHLGVHTDVPLVEADRKVKLMLGNTWRVICNSAKWQQNEPSEGQLKFLARLGWQADQGEVKLTRGSANHLINSLMVLKGKV